MKRLTISFIVIAVGVLLPIPAHANGNGNGNAVGKPAAGSVGNANDKTPGGQSSGDNNKGFKCDDNHGIGRTNPSHTGCTNEVTTTTTSTSTTSTTTTSIPKVHCDNQVGCSTTTTTTKVNNIPSTGPQTIVEGNSSTNVIGSSNSRTNISSPPVGVATPTQKLPFTG